VARTPEASLLTERHRLLQLALSAAALRDVLRLWGTVDPQDLGSTILPFVQASAIVARAGRKASAAAASRYYVDFRRLEGAAGQLVLTLPELPPVDVVEGSLRGAALAGITRARRAGRTAEQSAENGFVKVAGQASSFVLGGGRQTLMGAIAADPEARGWQRVTDPSPCAFCRMIASRGVIFKGEDDADFRAHGHCGCSAEPAFEGSRVRSENERFAAEWQEATQGLSGPEALNAYRRSLAAPKD
jgi:hypothetical protein